MELTPRSRPSLLADSPPRGLNTLVPDEAGCGVVGFSLAICYGAGAEVCQIALISCEGNMGLRIRKQGDSHERPG